MIFITRTTFARSHTFVNIEHEEVALQLADHP
jgi:hypothetical protein